MLLGLCGVISLPVWCLPRLLLVPLRGHCVTMPPNSCGVGAPDSSLLLGTGDALGTDDRAATQLCWEGKGLFPRSLPGFVPPARGDGELQLCGGAGKAAAAIPAPSRRDVPAQGTRHRPRVPPAPLPNGAGLIPVGLQPQHIPTGMGELCGRHWGPQVPLLPWGMEMDAAPGSAVPLSDPVVDPDVSPWLGQGLIRQLRSWKRLLRSPSRLPKAGTGGDRRVSPIPGASIACPGVAGRAGCGAGQLESGRSRSSSRAGASGWTGTPTPSRGPSPQPRQRPVHGSGGALAGSAILRAL